MSATACSECGQRLLLRRRGRTVCDRCRTGGKPEHPSPPRVRPLSDLRRPDIVRPPAGKCGICPSESAQPYPCGWRCAEHAPGEVVA